MEIRKVKLSKRKILKLLLRVGISAVFIVFLFCNTDTVGITESLIKTDHKVLILGVILYLLGQLISAYKWKLLAQTAGFRYKLKEYIDYYFTGMFFNLFLPTTVGGDITKCYYLAKGDPKNRKAPAVYSVLADRYTGVAVIVWMASIAMLFPIGNPVPIGAKIFMILLSLIILIFTFLIPVMLMFFLKRKKWVRTFLRDISVYLNNPRLIFKTLYWSTLFHLLIIAIHFTIGQAMGLNINPAYYFIIYPMSAMAGFIPVTFNGIGPREATYIFFFSLVGVKSSAALVFGIYWLGIVLISSLIGGISFIKGKYAPPPENFEITEEDMEKDFSEEPQAEF